MSCAALQSITFAVVWLAGVVELANVVGDRAARDAGGVMSQQSTFSAVGCQGPGTACLGRALVVMTLLALYSVEVAVVPSGAEVKAREILCFRGDKAQEGTGCTVVIAWAGT